MAKSVEEILKFIHDEYHSILVAAAKSQGHRVEVMAGILMRETQGGLSPLLDQPGPAGRGDKDKQGRYHGHGLFQIDDRSFPEFCSGEYWKNPSINAAFAAKVLAGKRKYITTVATQKDLQVADLERATIAAYNCGEGNVIRAISRGLDVDYFTAGRDYSSAVLKYAVKYQEVMNEQLRV